MKKKTTYKESGVDVAAGNEAVQRIRGMVAATHSDAVITGLGTFGALYDLGGIMKEYSHPVLVQSIDSVGTKLMVANMVGNHTSIGVDMVAHSCNDILCQGAKPLTFLDYIAVDKLDPKHIGQIMTGISKASLAAGLSVVGGETAELPGVYARGEYDLVGAVTGVVDKERMILGREISEKDIVIGLESSGLHTNGYSLARKVLFEVCGYKVDTVLDGLNASLGEELLRPHMNYSVQVLKLIEEISVKGIAHITGGGLVENVPRILPEGCAARINKKAWVVPSLFRIIQDGGNVPDDDIYRTLNMGIGLVIVVSPADSKKVLEYFASSGLSAFEIGAIVSGKREVFWE